MLELKNVKKSYDGTPVLRDISLDIEDGEIVSILGPSGCGKTTLLNLILGIVDSDGGRIFFNGEDITDVPMEKRGFNIVFQDYALFPNLNVYQNITYGLRNKPEISSKEEVEELIGLLGLEEHLEKRIGQLSGGQKQRVALARTMVMKPKILLLAVFFLAFLALPMIMVLARSFTADGTAGITFSNYVEVLTEKGFLQALGNSLLISVCSALVTTVPAFILAYTIHYTNVGRRYKKLVEKAAVLPMLLPTITYGFAIIYSFGNEGLLTKLFGRKLFDIYGFNGLLLGYVIYTLPISFMLIHNAMGYIDKRFMIVSRLMGDSPLQTFRMTILTPLLGTLAASFIQTFFLCFTDFGIPASVGGQFEVIASVLYTEMLGSVPNFGNGAVVALVMIIPSVVSITVLHILEKYNVRYSKISPIELKKGRKIHFFSTPYLMMKNSLSKMNASWETTAMLMGDNWIKTIARVVTPNAISTLLEVFSYYFVNAMVTVSAVIFLAGARTMVITTKIKELQYFNEYNEIFVLSLLILVTNLIGRELFRKMAEISRRKENKTNMNKKIRKMSFKKVAAFTLAAAVTVSGISLTGCGGGSGDQVIIYSNADDEAVEAMKNALDSNGYEGQYMFQTFGTSELGGKLLAEGTNIEADLVTMSTFYLESAQDQNDMFTDLDFDVDTIDEFPAYCAPITSQEGTIIVNTEMLEENDLPKPTSLKDLADPVYKGFVSVTDIASSSTAWLLIQALVSEYGEDGAKDVLTGIYDNAGDHIEDSGSAPLKKVRAGEAAVGFGLRQQAVADKADGLPIDFVDPEEGNFSLTESVAVVDKGDKTNDKAMEMAQCIIENGREELQSYYPNALYNGEETDAANQSANPKVFPEKLTVDLLEKHQELSEACK